MSRNVEESSQKIPGSISIQTRMIDFQNLTSSSLSTDTAPVKFSWEDWIRNFYVTLLTDKQTDRKTDKRRAKHNLLGSADSGE